MLSPTLFDRLRTRFGSVVIANEDESMECRYEKDLITDKMKMNIIAFGESYRINCPFCNDTRNRLYVNHRWNSYDRVTSSRNKFLVKCFNEDCVAGHEKQEKLADLVFDSTLNVYSPSPVEVSTPVFAKAPGPVQLLSLLPSNHHARLYIESRGYDPDYISQTFGVGYCSTAEPCYALAANRIYIPIRMNSELVGWQMRYIGDKVWKTERIPKYYSMPRMQKRNLLYNHDLAAQNKKIVVIVEGPSDAWAVGENAVALLGKTVTYQQTKLIKDVWGNGLVMVMLDNDAVSDDVGDPYSSANDAIDKLRAAGISNVRRIDLPNNTDPGDLQSSEIWETIHKCLEESK